MERLKRLREARGLSQIKLAQRADLNPATVNQIEGGKRAASPGTLHKLAVALDVSLYELLEGEPRPKAGSSSLEPSLNDVLADERRKPEYLREQLAAHHIEVSNSEAVVLAQYLEVEENPPEDTYVIAHVKKENEPVDHGRVLMLLAALGMSRMLTDEEAAAGLEKLRRELVAA
jgi:transcriptional regulator with XRE-family HTH domain